MPLTRYQVRNEYGLADPELYADIDSEESEALLEGIAMAGLVGILRQLGDLAEFAAEIFHDLHDEVVGTAARGHGLMDRVQQLEAEFPSIEKDILSETDHSSVFSNSGMDWHPNLRMKQNLIIRENSPRCIMDSYEESREPPRLYLLDKFDVNGAGACLKRYSNPSFFKVEPAASEISSFRVRREKRSQKLKKKGRKDRENPETAPTSHAKLHQLFMQDIGSDYSDNACSLNLKRGHLTESPLNSNSKNSYMEKLFQTPSPQLKTAPQIHLNPQALMSSTDSSSGCKSAAEAPDISVFDAVEASCQRNRIEGSVCNMHEVLLTPSPEYLNCHVSERDMGIVSEPFTDGGKREISPNIHKMMTEKILLNDGKDKQSRSLFFNSSGEFTSGVDSYMDVHVTMDHDKKPDNECRPMIELTHLNTGTHKIDSGVNEEKMENLSQLQNGKSMGHGLVSDEECNSLSEGKSSASNSNSLSSYTEKEPSDAEELATSSSCTETGIAETEDATFSQLSGNKEMAGTTSSVLVYIYTEDIDDGSISNLEEESSDAEELSTSSSSTETGIAETENAAFNQLSGNKEMAGTTSYGLVYIRAGDTDDGSIVNLEEEPSDAEELATSSSSPETGIAGTENAAFSQLSGNKEKAGTTSSVLVNVRTRDTDDDSIINLEEEPFDAEELAKSSSSAEIGVAETEDATSSQLFGDKEIAGATSSAHVYIRTEDTDDGSITNLEEESFTCAKNVSFIPQNPETNLLIGPKTLSIDEVKMNMFTSSVVSSVHFERRDDPIFQDLAPEEKETGASEDEIEAKHGDRCEKVPDWESGSLQSNISSVEAHFTHSAKQEMAVYPDTLLLSIGSEIDTTIVAAIAENGLLAESDNTSLTREANLRKPSTVYIKETEFDQSSEVEVQVMHLPRDDASSKSLNIKSDNTQGWGYKDHEKDLNASPHESSGVSFQNPLFEVLRRSSVLPSFSEASQTSLDETPPLPPLPPVQWRIGKFQPAEPDTKTNSIETTVTPFPTLPLFSPGNNNYGFAPSGYTPQQFASILSRPSPVSCQLPTTDSYTTTQQNSVLPAITPFENLDSVLLAESYESPSHDFLPVKRKEEQSTPNVSSPVSAKHVAIRKDLVSSEILSGKGGSPPCLAFVPKNRSSREQSQLVTLVSNGQTANQLNSSCTQDVLSFNATCLAPPRIEVKKANDNPSIVKLSRPKNPVIDAVTVLDRSMLRKVSERARSPPEPKVDERDSLLEQIRNKSFNLRKTTEVSRPNIKVGPKTNLKIAAILEKAKTIRQVTVGSDEEDSSDNWSDS